MGSRWQRLSDAFERFGPVGYWPFIHLHAALVYLYAGHRARLARLGVTLEQAARARSYAGERARDITLPALRALRTWAAGSAEEAAGLFAALKSTLRGAGGSRIQLALFEGLAREPHPGAETTRLWASADASARAALRTPA